MPIELDPRVRRFQEIKARRRKEATARTEKLNDIKRVNPNLSDKQAQQVLDAHLRAQQAKTIEIRGPKGKIRKVKVYYA